MSAFTFYKYLCLTGKLSTLFTYMTVLTACMATIRSYFITKLFTRMMLMRLLATLFMTLNGAFMATFK